MSKSIRIITTLTLALALTACASLITGGPLIRDGEPTGAIEIVNGSRQTLTVVLISDCSAASYGLNRLPSGATIPPGRSYRFTVSAGCWDVDAGLATSSTSYADSRFRTQVAPGRISRHRIVD